MFLHVSEEAPYPLPMLRKLVEMDNFSDVVYLFKILSRFDLQLLSNTSS